MDNLDGHWKCTTAKLGGEDFKYKNYKSQIKGTKYKAIVNDQVDEGELLIDSTKSPKTIDILGTEGPSKGKKIPAIYKLEGKNLTVCFNIMGSARPSEFSSTKENGFLLVSYKKIPLILSWF